MNVVSPSSGLHNEDFSNTGKREEAMNRFEATFFDENRQFRRLPFETPQEAIEVVEKAGTGNVAKLRLVENRPGCLPEFLFRSVSFWRYENGQWKEVDIYCNMGSALGKSKPE